MPEINDEMRVTADYAITSAKERYGLVLDYTEDSLVLLGNILEKIYWGFSSHTRTEGQDGLIYNTAIIWGSYVGEYMRLKWGGTWILKGSERVVSITSIEFSPISFVYQKITDHPEYSVENYVYEAKKLIYTSVIHPKKSQVLSESVGQPIEQKPSKVTHAPPTINRRLIVILGSIIAVLIVAAGCITGYSLIRSGGIPAFGFIDKIPSTNTETALPILLASETAAATNTSTSTMTQLPTYTPNPTKTPRPSRTPLLVNTSTASSTPTETQTPTETEVPYVPPTRTRTPTETNIPHTRTPTPTPQPSPTNTPVTPPPPTIVSCGVSPSTVPAGQNPNPVTFSVQFSEGGHSITGVSFDPTRPGQAVGSCRSEGDTASCNGDAGLLGSGDQISVVISTDLGDVCSTGYTAQ